jgi:photosystem I reaction center subunit XII
MNLSDGQVFTALLVSLFPAVMAALLEWLPNETYLHVFLHKYKNRPRDRRVSSGEMMS